MTTITVTEKVAGSGVSGITGRTTKIQVQLASVVILVGGPYTDANGERHEYGHAALRVLTQNNERIYDFGRYQPPYWGIGDSEGYGILRVWTSFTEYIKGENAYGRMTKGFTYPLGNEQAERTNQHYNQMLNGLKPTRQYGNHMSQYRLARDYHGLYNNCTTMVMSGVRLVFPELEKETSQFNIGRGLDFTTRAAASLKGWPVHIFMPADLQTMLESNTVRRPIKIQAYGLKR